MALDLSTIEAVDNSLTHIPVGSAGPGLCTKRMTAAMMAARTLAPNGYGYGKGGGVRLHTGVFRTGAQRAWSRVVGVKGAGGALGGSTIQGDYTELNGVPGEDAFWQMADDGSQQSSVVMQQIFEGFSIDGQRGKEPPGHIRHGLWWPAPAEGRTDRVGLVRDVHIAGVPGSGIKIDHNDQLRGGNFKCLDCGQYGIDANKVSDGKAGDIGLGGNTLGAYRFTNCASFEFSKLDGWTSKGFAGQYLGQVISCKALEIIGGQHEGAILVQGDNDKPASGAYRWDCHITYNHVGFKTSVDFKAARGAAYDCHIHVKNLFGLRLPGCTFGCGKSYGGELDPDTAAARPPYAIRCEGDCLVDCMGAEFIAIHGTDELPTHVAFTAAICDHPEMLLGVRYGEIVPRPLGRPGPGEFPADGGLSSRRRYPLGYLYTGADYSRRLTDPVEEFARPDWRAVPIAPGWGWFVVLE